VEPQPLRGRPGTKPLPLAGGGRVVGGPIALALLASYILVALAAWLATAIVRSTPVAYTGGAFLLGAALAGCAGTLSTWRSRWD
jgi:hypothetical protein